MNLIRKIEALGLSADRPHVIFFTVRSTTEMERVMGLSNKLAGVSTWLAERGIEARFVLVHPSERFEEQDLSAIGWYKAPPGKIPMWVDDPRKIEGGDAKGNEEVTA